MQTKCDRVEDEAPLPPIGIETIQALPYFKHLHYGALNNRGRAALDEALADAIGWLRDPERLGAHPCSAPADCGFGDGWRSCATPTLPPSGAAAVTAR